MDRGSEGGRLMEEKKRERSTCNFGKMRVFLLKAQKRQTALRKPGKGEGRNSHMARRAVDFDSISQVEDA